MRITSTGTYTTRSGLKVQVTMLERGWAKGEVTRHNGRTTKHVWRLSTGMHGLNERRSPLDLHRAGYTPRAVTLTEDQAATDVASGWACRLKSSNARPWWTPLFEERDQAVGYVHGKGWGDRLVAVKYFEEVQVA